MPGQEIPAVPPCLTLSRPLSAYQHTPTGLRQVIPSHILRLFLLALRSPFGSTFSAALPPSAALCKKRGETYLLFLNGLLTFYTTGTKMSILLINIYINILNR